MSRKHFQALADELKHSKPDTGDVPQPKAMAQWVRDCKAVARACRSMNARFDEGRFLAACGCDDE